MRTCDPWGSFTLYDHLIYNYYFFRLNRKTLTDLHCPYNSNTGIHFEQPLFRLERERKGRKGRVDQEKFLHFIFKNFQKLRVHVFPPFPSLSVPFRPFPFLSIFYLVPFHSLSFSLCLYLFFFWFFTYFSLFWINIIDRIVQKRWEQKREQVRWSRFQCKKFYTRSNFLESFLRK